MESIYKLIILLGYTEVEPQQLYVFDSENYQLLNRGNYLIKEMMQQINQKKLQNKEKEDLKMKSKELKY